MTHLRGLDAHLQPTETPLGNYHVGPCADYIGARRVQPADLDADLARLQGLLTPVEGFPLPNISVLAAQRLIASLRNEALQMPEAEDVECGYEGVVEAEWHGDRRGNGDMVWTCPRCGNDQSDARTAGDDDPNL
jgi:hypothetical protein